MNISYIPSEMGGDPLSNIASPPRLEERERTIYGRKKIRPT
jgi:hypothetical protein